MRRKQAKSNKRFIFILIAIAVFGFLLFKTAQYIPLVWQLLFNSSIELKKTNNHINILLLGIGGGTHDGPDLSDTMIFVSIDPDKKNVTLVSVPRDLWITDLKAKINTAYASGQEDGQKKGLVLAKAVVSKITGQEINYGIRIDFAGFVKAVDLVGGLDIVVDDTLDDYAYPIEGKENDPCGHTPEEINKLATASSEFDGFGCRYMHIHFDKGLHHFDGKEALEYVRSRHALGPEGTDFARSRRQQKVITAFKDNVFSVETLLNPVKIIGLYSTVKDSIDTDVVQSEIDDFVRLAQKLKGAKINSTVLDYGDSTTNRPGLLVHPHDATPYSGAWVLIPRTGENNYTEIQKYIDCEIKIGNCKVSVKQ